MKRLFSQVTAAGIIFCAFAAIMPAFAENNLTIRVCILDDRDEFKLELKGRYKIYEINTNRVLMEGPYLNDKVRSGRSGILIGSREFNAGGFKIIVDKDSNIYVDGRRFRGGLDVLRKDNGKLLVINYVGLEEYLYGVLYHEVSHRWPIEALKAQAITARTFALYQIKQSKLQPYDVRNDIYSQVYGGRNSERWSTTRAVDVTRGKVLIYDGNIFPAYYHATCAGRTEDASNLWNVDLPVLKGAECGYCMNSKHYKWNLDIPLWLITNTLKNKGYIIGNIVSVGVLSTNASGRVDKIEIKDDREIAIILTGKDFRQIFDPNKVRSTKFKITSNKNMIMLNGMGWGHGVGMCQWGAYGMSRKGKKAEEILSHYYPGSQISTIDKLKI